MSVLAVPRIIDAISRHEPATYEAHRNTRFAAVAVILRPVAGATEALFIERARKEGDPWSGQMAFPGGHRDPGDSHLRDTAVRETLEEIGLDLEHHGTFVGEIDSVRANPRGRDIDMVVAPFVFVLNGNVPRLTPNYEVANVLWGRLDDMYTGDSLTMGEFVIQGERHRYPGYDVDGRIVWGLTYRMLDQFFGMMDPSWQPHDPPG